MHQTYNARYDAWERVVSLHNRVHDTPGAGRQRALTYRDYTHPVVLEVEDTEND